MGPHEGEERHDRSVFEDAEEGHAWYRIDLFFHRRLRCLVVVDLKLGKFTRADAGQMHPYLNYSREHWMLVGKNPPVGIILCAEYRTALPEERVLVEAVETTCKDVVPRICAPTLMRQRCPRLRKWLKNGPVGANTPRSFGSS